MLLFNPLRYLLAPALLGGALLLAGCPEKAPPGKRALKAVDHAHTLFRLVPAAQSGVAFRNDLVEDELTNVLVYEYTYNGGGVAAGDVNGDGLDDLYFTANKGSNRLYLNKGNLKFEDVTTTAGVGLAAGWKTGVTMVDINADGQLDMYVCRSGDRPGALRQNQLFVNLGPDKQGVPRFREQAAACGLADSAFSTQAVFFDYDHDQDLDMLLLNHSPRRFEGLDDSYIKQLLATPDALTGLKLYQNQGAGAAGALPRFREVGSAAGLLNTRLSFGLGASVTDFNRDGWPDIYVSSDYLAPDYLYINNKDGTFTDRLGEQIGHTSLSSMGNDAADINNDGTPDLVTLDMLPADNQRQKLLFASDNFELFQVREQAGLHKQYMRNMLHLNNGNGTFSEVGQLAGVSNTDWSWAPLLADYDNDGWKDLFVTNGFLHDYTNLDFLKYMGDFLHDRQGDVQRQTLLELVRKMPSSNMTGYAFRNQGGAHFADVSAAWGITTPANGSGATYADLDNDGDLDLVVNNLNGPAFLYENRASKLLKNRALTVRLDGAGKNRLGIGARVTLYRAGASQVQEQLVSRGYQSSVSPVLHFGLGAGAPPDSVRVEWPSGRQQMVTPVPTAGPLVLREAAAHPARPAHLVAPVALFTAVASPLQATATENEVNDFKRQPLLVSSLSYSGPCLAQADVNGDGRPDVFMGGAAGYPARVFAQQASGQFTELYEPALAADNLPEDSAALFFDADGDGDQDLYVGSGGYDNFMPTDLLLQDRLYFNDGRGNFSLSPASLPFMPTSTGCVRVADVNGDGHPDLFVGGRVVPGRYPEAPASYLLLNDGRGRFTDQTARWGPALRHLGMVTDAAWVDMNGDQRPDLVTVGEWLPVQVWLNEGGHLAERTATYLPGPLTGWWNTLLVKDLNGDGKPDFVVGNVGLNTQCRASTREPAELVYKDFDDNGAVDPILCLYNQGKSYPYVSRDELLDQVSMTRARFPNYASYAGAGLTDIFSKEELQGAKVLRANTLQTTCLLSTPRARYRLAPLPPEAQYTPVYALAAGDYDGDGHPDLLLGGNISHSRVRFGNADAGHGLLLRGNGRGGFAAVPAARTGLRVPGDIRSFVQVGRVLLVGRNGQAVQAYSCRKH